MIADDFDICVQSSFSYYIQLTNNYLEWRSQYCFAGPEIAVEITVIKFRG